MEPQICVQAVQPRWPAGQGQRAGDTARPVVGFGRVDQLRRSICGVPCRPPAPNRGHGQPRLARRGVLLRGGLSQCLQNTAVDPVPGHPHLEVGLARPVLQGIVQVWLVPAQGEQVPAYLIGNRAL